jgi:hypothetical protein
MASLLRGGGADAAIHRSFSRQRKGREPGSPLPLKTRDRKGDTAPGPGDIDDVRRNWRGPGVLFPGNQLILLGNASSRRATCHHLSPFVVFWRRTSWRLPPRRMEAGWCPEGDGRRRGRGQKVFFSRRRAVPGASSGLRRPITGSDQPSVRALGLKPAGWRYWMYRRRARRTLDSSLGRRQS